MKQFKCGDLVAPIDTHVFGWLYSNHKDHFGLGSAESICVKIPFMQGIFIESIIKAETIWNLIIFGDQAFFAQPQYLELK